MTPLAAAGMALLGMVALGVLVAVLAAAVYLGYQRGPSRPRKPLEAPPEPSWEPRMAAIEVRMDGMAGLWEEERRRAEAARDRERYYARKRRAKRDEEGDDDDDAGQDVRGGDAAGGGAQGMLPLSGSMGDSFTPPEPEHLRRAREAYGYPWGLVS
jgi:hypothetical protein